MDQIDETRGKVSSVFNNSFDVRLGNCLLNFNCRNQALHPLGVLIEDNLLVKISRGAKAKLENNSLYLAGRKFVLIPGIKTVNNNYTIRKDVINNNLQKLKNYIGVFGTETGFPAEEYQAAFSEFEKENLNTEKLFDFFGDGPGLTPAFDDFVAGMLLVDRKLANNKILITDNLLEKLKKKTTLASWWQLKFADRGVFSLGWEKFVARLLGGKIDATSTLRRLKFGHSSGTDICRGIYFYLSGDFI